MANTHEPALLEKTCAGKRIGENESRPTSSVQLSKKASSACPPQQQVRLQHVQKEDVDLEHRVVIAEDPLGSKQDAQQHKKEVMDDISLQAVTQYLQKPSKLPNSEEETEAGAVLPEDKGSDVTRTEQDELFERRVTANESRAREKVRDAEKTTLKRTASRPLLLPPRERSTDRTIDASGTSASAEGGETRVSNDSLCSPTAFSVAATAASLTCSSPPSCTSLEERDVINKLGAEGDAAERIEDLQRQGLAQRRVTPLIETRLHAVGTLHEAKSCSDQQLQHPHSEYCDLVKLEQLQTQRLQYEIRNEHTERQKGKYDIMFHSSDQLLRSAAPREIADENKSVEDKREEFTSARCAAVTDRSTGTYITGETFHVSPKATGGDISTTADNWAPSPSLGKTLQSYTSAGEAERIQSPRSQIACSEGEIETLAPVNSEEVTAPLRTRSLAIDRKCTTAATRSSRGSTQPWGEVLELAGRRTGPTPTEADFRCSQPDPPTCCFCSSMNELAFPPPPARLVANFIAYVFEPQLQRLRRRLQENTHQEPWRKLLFDRSNGEGVKKFSIDSTSTATVSTQATTQSSQAPEPTTADKGAAAYLGLTKAYDREASLSSEGSYPPCFRGRQLIKSSSASPADTWSGCLCNLEVGGEAQKPASSAMRAECGRLGFAPSVTRCAPLSAPSVPNGSSAEFSSFSAAHPSAIEFGGTVSAAIAPDAIRATALQKRPQSALLALQLKQHLLSLVCYMERLPKRSRLGLADSSAARSVRPNQPASPGELCKRHVLEPWQRRPSRDTDGAAKCSIGLHESNQFAFHIEQLLRAEIVVQPVLPVTSQAKGARVFSTPILPHGEISLKHSGVVEHNNSTAAASSAPDCNKNQTARADTSKGEVSPSAVGEKKTSPTGKGHTPEHAVACTLPTDAATTVTRAGETAEVATEVVIGEMPEKKWRCSHEAESAAEKDLHLNRDRDTKGITTAGAQRLVHQPSQETVGASPLTYNASASIPDSDELLPKTAEDAVLLGAPPSMVNYLIVFSPLLVLQALQHMVGAATGEDPRGCSCTTHAYDRGATCNSVHVPESSREELGASSGSRSVTYVGENTAAQRSRTPMTAVQDSVVSRSCSLATKQITPIAADLEGIAGGEYPCAGTTISGRLTRRNRTEREERENPGIEQIANSAPEPAFEVAAAGSETGQGIRSGGCSRAPAGDTAEASKAALQADSEGGTNEARFRARGPTFNRSGFTSSALQAELKSALCWADRGLVALFRASSAPHTAPPASTAYHVHPFEYRSHNRSTTVRQKPAPNACQHISEEVTPASLTAALVLLAKAVKQSRSGHTGEVYRRASSHSNCDRCAREAVCAGREQLLDSWHADCYPLQHPLVTCERLPSTALSHNAPDSLPSLATVLAELDSRQQQRWHHLHYSKESGEDVHAETQPQQKENAMKEEEGRAKLERTKTRLECASSRAVLTTPTRGEELGAKVESLELPRLHTFVSPSLLPSASAHDGGSCAADKELVCPLSLRARERGAAVFFAPLHYPQQGCARYTSTDDRKLQFEAPPPKESPPANAIYARRGAPSIKTGTRISTPVTEGEFKPSADTVEGTAEDDLVERLALEILAHVDNAAFCQEEDALGMEWQQWSKEHRQGKNSANATNEDSPDFGRIGPDKQVDTAATDDWLRQVAQLFTGRAGQEKSDISERSCFRACGRDHTPLGEEEGPCVARSCSSEDVHEYGRGVSRQEVLKSNATARHCRSLYRGKPVTEAEVYSKAPPFSQYTKQNRYCVEGDILLPELREREVASYVNCSGFAGSARMFETIRRIQAEDKSATTGDSKRSGSFKESPLLQDRATPHVARRCAFFENATSEENPKATEKGGSALDVAAGTAPTVAGGDEYVYVVSPEDRVAPHSATEKGRCCSGIKDTLNSVRADETDFSGTRKGEEHHQREKCEGACDSGKARASVREVVEQQDVPQARNTEESRSHQNLQHWAIVQSSGDLQVEPRRNLPSSACNRVGSSSSTSKFPGLRRAISNQHCRTTNEGGNCSWEDAENSESNKDSGNLRLARTRGNQRRTCAEDERRAEEEEEEGEEPGHTHLLWHCGPPRQQQRSSQTADATEPSAREKGGEVRSCRVKRLVPCREDETTCQNEQSARDRGNCTRRSGTTEATHSPGEEALRTRETLSVRAPSAVYNESEDRKGSWPDGDQRASLEHFGSADETDAGLDTRRPMRGVYFDRTQRSWIGSFYEDRRQIKKRFKVDTYGFLKAKALAVDVRLGYERRMLSGVVGAAGCAASSGAEAASKVKRVAAAGQDAAPSVDTERENRKPEMFLAGGDAESWRNSATNKSAHVQVEFPSLASQQRKGHLNTFTKNKSTTSPGVMAKKDTQVDSDVWVTLETHSSSLDRPPGHAASGLTRVSVKKLPECINVTDYEKPGELSTACVEQDSATEERSENGSSLCSYASNGLTSHVFWSPGSFSDTSLNSANARSGGVAESQQILRKELEESKRKKVGRASSHFDSDNLGMPTGVDAHTSQVDVEAPNTSATQLFAIQSRNGIPLKPAVCSVAASGMGDECLSHTGTPTAAVSGSQPKLDTHSEQEEQDKQSDRENELAEGCESELLDRYLMSEDEKAQTGTETTREETGRTRQRRAAPDGRCLAERREFGEQNVSVQDIYSHKYVCEKTLSMPIHLAAQQRVEDLANRDTLHTAASRRLAKGTSQSGKCLHNCANLTEKETPASSTHSCAHRAVGTRTAAGTTREKRAFLTNRLEGRSGHPFLKVRYLIEDGAVRKTTEKQESGERIVEREERSSTSSASGPWEGHPHEASDKNGSAPNLRRGKALALLNSEAMSRADGGHKNGSSSSAGAQQADASRVTTSVRSNSCNRLCTNESPPTRPSTKRPEVAAVAYMCSKRKKRPADAISEGGRGVAPFFVHDLPLGVFYTSKKHAYCANWYEGKRQLKRYFPICKLGEPEARRLAIAARRDAERREREARCRTGGSSSTQTGCNERKGFLNTAYAEHDLPSDPAAMAPAPSELFHRRAASEDVCAVQTEQVQANR